MNEEEFYEEYYRPGEGPGADENKFIKWMRHNFQHGRAMVIGSFLAIGALSWWAVNWMAPIGFLIVFFVVLKIMRSFRKDGQTIVIECRLQGEIIKHCPYFQKPIQVPNTGVKVWLLPHSRWEDVLQYGDDVQAAKTRNVVFCDYFEPLPNKDIIMVFAKEANFSNFALYSRLNEDLARDMAEIGEQRAANEDFKDTVIDLYHEGRFGEPDSVDALFKLKALVSQSQVIESKLGNNEAAKRNIWLYYKDIVPKLHKQLMLLEQEIPRRAMAEASKLIHAIVEHPMSAEIHEKVQEMLTPPELYDYEERVQSMVQKGQHNLEATDADEVSRSVIRGETTHVN